MAVVVQTVNLWDAGALRGTQPETLQSVSLPAAMVTATSVTSGNQERVSVDLDLSNAKAGEYFLSTTHEQNQASYYYPLQVK